MACNPNSIVEGTTPIIEMKFRDVDDVLENPNTITAVHLKPDATETSYVQSDPEIIEESTGIWRLTLPAVAVGTHLVTVVGTGSTTSTVSKVRFKVKSDGVATV
jgi:hypothetical protein